MPDPVDRAQPLYIRQGTHVQGPYPRDKVRALARAGRLTPTMELSADQATWTPASAVPGLLPSRDEQEEEGREPSPPTRPAPRKRNRELGIVLGILGLLLVGWQLYSRHVPSNVKLWRSLAEREQPILKELETTVGSVPDSSSDEVRSRVARKVRDEIIPRIRELRREAGAADANDALLDALARYFDGRIALLAAVADEVEKDTPEHVSAVRAKLAALQQLASNVWEATPSKFRTAANPFRGPLPF